MERDFCTGRPIDINHPEEQVRQETERWLVEDMGYNKNNIAIELRLRVGSSNRRPDILIFKNQPKDDFDQHKDILGLVEIKSTKIEDAERQLKTYMAVSSSCQWGIAVTKDARQYYRRNTNGDIERIHAIPIAGLSLENAIRLKKSDLKPTKNLKLRFKSILFHLYSNTNIQSREKLCNEMTKILFCKIHDERLDSEIPIFQFPSSKTQEEVKKDIEEKLWKGVCRDMESASVFREEEGIILDADSVAYVVGELERVSLLGTDCDVIGAAFEVFAERYFAGEKGEFFTPRIAVKNAISLLSPKYGEKIIDPACGSGGFVVQALETIWREIELKGGRGKEQKHKNAPNNMYGIDKEPDLVKVARSYMSLVGDGHTHFVDDDSLKPIEKWNERTRVCLTEQHGKLKEFDIVLTNPPFGSKIKVIHDYILEKYDLGHSWKKIDGHWCKTDETKPTTPQVLFLELCFRLLKKDGRMCIVLPESILANLKEEYVRYWIINNMEILAIWDCPQNLFLPHTNTKTCILFLRKNKVAYQRILMSYIKKCGHDQRGAEIRTAKNKVDEEFSLAKEDWLNYQPPPYTHVYMQKLAGQNSKSAK